PIGRIAVYQEGSIHRGIPPIEHDGALFTGCIGVHQHPLRAVVSVTHVQYRLILSTVTTLIEISAAPYGRCPDPANRVQLGQAVSNRGSSWNRLEQGGSVLILLSDPIP